MAPLTSIELRWFLDGAAAVHGDLQRWFDAHEPFRRAAGVGAPLRQPRRGGDPDVYLLLDGCEDMGIKWREATLQVKGLVAEPGVRRYGQRHSGRVQRWIKWTFAQLPPAWSELFHAGREGAPVSVAVHKVRALRLLSIGAAGEVLEVAPGAQLERGVGVELTDLECGGGRYCTVGFEAFPDDNIVAGAFDAIVERCLDGLTGTPLAADASSSYPGWLAARAQSPRR